jgi:hypothetical protein
MHGWPYLYTEMCKSKYSQSWGRLEAIITGKVYFKFGNIQSITQASTLTYFSTCPFGQLTKKCTCLTQSFSCPKKLIKITKTRE